MDMVVEQTHAPVHGGRDPERQMRYMDNRQDEQDREGFHQGDVDGGDAAPSGKHLLFNSRTPPGTRLPRTSRTASLRLADAVLLVVDAVEGDVRHERVIKHAARDRLPIVVFVNKMDRSSSLELKLPPADAFHKIRHVLEEVNAATKPRRRRRGLPAPR